MDVLPTYLGHGCAVLTAYRLPTQCSHNSSKSVIRQNFVLKISLSFNVKSTDHIHVDEIGQNHLPVDTTSEKFSGINILQKNIHFLTEPSKHVKKHVGR